MLTTPEGLQIGFRHNHAYLKLAEKSFALFEYRPADYKQSWHYYSGSPKTKEKWQQVDLAISYLDRYFKNGIPNKRYRVSNTEYTIEFHIGSDTVTAFLLLGLEYQRETFEFRIFEKTWLPKYASNPANRSPIGLFLQQWLNHTYPDGYGKRMQKEMQEFRSYQKKHEPKPLPSLVDI